VRQAGGGPAPLSFPQERLFILDRMMPGVSAYNVPHLVRVGATLDEAALQRAFDAVVARHEILRTTIKLVDGAPVQEVAPEARVELTVSDLRDAPAESREAEAMALLGELARRPFDLAHDVLLRAGLVHVAADEDLLLVVSHHMGSDHASSGILFAELEAVYSGTEELPELPIQYADFALAQRERVSGPHLEELLAYWTEQLAGVPERLDLPADRPRPAMQSFRGATYRTTIAPELASSLRTLARANGVSLFMTLLAAFETVLHRYTGADDFVVGTPISGRHEENTQQLIGYLSNTLALRSDVSGDPAFTELLARVKVTTLAGQAYQELPFEKLVEVLNPERALSHTPLFQVLLTFDIAPSTPPTLGGRPLEELPVPGWEWSRFDFSLGLSERPDGSLSATYEYATDLFDEATVVRFSSHLETLLQGVVQDPARRLSELPLLTEDERRELAGWNATAQEFPRRCLHELVAEQAERRPDALAVVADAERITYGELDRRANQLAHELQALGVEPRALVGICLERGVDLVVSLLGVLKAGAAYVPVDPTYPADRQAFIFADAEVGVLLTQESLLGGIDAGAATVLCLDRDRDRIADRSDTAPAVEVDAEQLAYVIYTSGSTGRPKGVEITHRSVANLMAYMREQPGLGEDDVLVNLTTPAFDLSVPDWYLPLTTGARLVIVPREVTLDGIELAGALARAGATFVQATPTMWQLLVDAGWPGSNRLKVVCGGEALPRTLANDLVARAAELWHMYGPTETTVWSSILRLEAGEGPPPLGGPIANTTFHIVDGNGEQVPTSVPGELLIGGAGLARAYHEQPDLTAEKFVSDRFGSSERLYRTGDLVRRRADGTLEFLGRIDHQVKLRGYRIELGEIEEVLAQHENVRTAVAIVREDVPGDRRLVAYVVPSGGETPSVEDLRALAKAKLPPFMVPSAIVTLDELPATPNRKLDRTTLPAPDGARPELQRPYAPPSGPVEELLASIWRELLTVDQAGIDDDFFDLGGHSLLAVAMLSRVQDEFGIELPLGAVFARPTIRELAESVTAALLGEASEDELAELIGEPEASEL
jgi:amino acid adenylation domain-containing protein